MKDQRSVILSAMPTEHVELKTIFSDKPRSLRRLLEDPPTLRSNGWGIYTGDQAKFMRGELIRLEGYRSIVDLYRDGTLIFAGRISRDFLAWADNTDSRLHPLALAEVVINFARFYEFVLNDFRSRPIRLEFQVELRNMWMNGEKTRLHAGPVTNEWWEVMAGPPREAPAATWSYKLLVDSATFNADRTAFQLIRELYVWFGHSEEAIPYTTETELGSVSDAEAIAKIR